MLEWPAVAKVIGGETARDRTGRDGLVDVDPHPRLAGYRLTDLTALAGAACWLGAVAAGFAGVLALSEVELFVSLAVLVLVPLGLGVAATPGRTGETPLPYTVATVGQLPAAPAVVGSLALPVGSTGSVVLVLPWLAVTGAVALFGLWRVLSRGLWPLPELAVDAALFYVPVGAVALLLHRAGISLRFQPIIILLTVVHYHYAGFVLPLVTGLADRRLAGDDGRLGTDLAGRVATAATVVIVVNLALIAVGITFSPLVEVVAVAFFTVAVAGFAVLLLREVVPAVGGLPGGALALAAVCIFLTMTLALAYGYSAFPATGELIDIGRMIRWHGTLNAFGFALPALLAFRYLD
jgi:hypothetical protein